MRQPAQLHGQVELPMRTAHLSQHERYPIQYLRDAGFPLRELGRNAGERPGKHARRTGRTHSVDTRPGRRRGSATTCSHSRCRGPLGK